MVSGIRHWMLWSLPGNLLAYVLFVDVTSLAVTVALTAAHGPTSRDLLMCAVIIGLGVLTGELSRNVERIRRRFYDEPHVNLTSVWTVAAVFVLPPGLTALVVAALYLHLWFRLWYRNQVGPHRMFFSAIVIMLACHAASVVQLLLGPPSLITVESPTWGVVLASAVFSIVNTGLVAGAIGLAERTLAPARLLGTWHANALEFATICLGVLAAILLVWKPLLVLLVIPVLHVLHRSLLIRQFEQAAATDAKTGLLNASTWHVVAAKEYERAGRDGSQVGILMIDLDHFKRVNDRYGHLAGDRVLQAVATTLSAEVRRYDVIGRFGGEEFVVALPEIDDTELVKVGERICERIRSLEVPAVTSGQPEIVRGLTASIGAAVHPATDGKLDDVLLAADGALFSAKESGRDQVVASRTLA